ncbi:hypothetical protein [Leifsonia sp. NPDC080035]|uniref:Uncharacterized protein n=1 Tax=Leifsonia sp. NPDC080035 TaxID=3143936 RepID=A0AAU7G7G1_9MICO
MGDGASREEWEQRDLISGRSAFEWARVGVLGLVTAAAGGLGAAICAVTIVAANQAIDAVTIACLTTFLIGSVVLLISSRQMKRKERLELAAGYTTLMQGHYDVERRHSPTGVVVRGAGQQALNRVQEREAKQRVQEYLQRSGR